MNKIIILTVGLLISFINAKTEIVKVKVLFKSKGVRIESSKDNIRRTIYVKNDRSLLLEAFPRIIVNNKVVDDDILIKYSDFNIADIKKALKQKIKIELTTQGLATQGIDKAFSFMNLDFWVNVVLNHYDLIGGRLVSNIRYQDGTSYGNPFIQEYTFQIPN